MGSKKKLYCRKSWKTQLKTMVAVRSANCVYIWKDFYEFLIRIRSKRKHTDYDKLITDEEKRF